MTRRLSLTFGLLIGAMWAGEVIFGNLGETAMLGNVRTLHFATYRLVGWAFIGSALVLTAVAGFVGAYRTGRVREGLTVGAWSGLISGAITFVAVMAVFILFRNALLLAPSNVKEFAGSTRAMLLDALAAGLNHMWIGPLLGVTLGGVAAVAGNWFHNPPVARGARL
jgi:hypothetical protein